MAFERYTDRARKVVEFASEEAKRLGCESVDTIHLMLGMLREGKGVAGNVLKHMGVDAERVLTLYDRYRNESDVVLEDIESRSISQAEWLGHNYVGTEHLALAVFGCDGCRASKVVEDIGVVPQKLCHEVLCLLGHEDQFEQWLADQPE